MEGTKAPGSPGGLIRLGDDQVPVKPDSEVEITTWSFRLPLKLASQVTYNWPLRGSIAGDTMMPDRTARNGFRGSEMPTTSSLLISWRSLQVVPPSREITSSTLIPPWLSKNVKKLGGAPVWGLSRIVLWFAR